MDNRMAGVVVRYRRNALVANTLGVFGVLLSVALIFINTGLFESRDNERATAVLIFVPSYAAILYGCWWWVKAKNWSEAVVFLGVNWWHLFGSVCPPPVMSKSFLFLICCAARLMVGMRCW